MSAVEALEPPFDPADSEGEVPAAYARFVSVEMRNFLSYKRSTFELGDFVALVGPNSSGKSNAVAAIRLLTEIRTYGLPLAIMRRGGYDQLRHRSSGHPYDPTLRLNFTIGEGQLSFYELSLGSVKGGRYRVKREHARVWWGPRRYEFTSDGSEVQIDAWDGERVSAKVAPGQSAISQAGMAGYIVFDVLGDIQTLDVNPKVVGELQEPSSTEEFAPDGSNVASIFEDMSPDERRTVTDDLAVLVPGIQKIEVPHLADKVTLRFHQLTSEGKSREFLAKQMSDGTLRMLTILLAAHKAVPFGLLVIEEPETAIHLGALRNLVEIVRARADSAQVVITTHSADIVDALPIEDLRVVWTEADASRISVVAEHTKDTVTRGLMEPGDMLRADLLDPADA